MPEIDKLFPAGQPAEDRLPKRPDHGLPGVLPGSPAVNDLGGIAGTCWAESGWRIPLGSLRAVLRENGHVHDLNDLIPPDSALELSWAVAIDDAGRVLAQARSDGCADRSGRAGWGDRIVRRLTKDTGSAG